MTVIIKYDIAPLFIIFFVVLLLLGMFSYILTLPLKYNSCDSCFLSSSIPLPNCPEWGYRKLLEG